jgi:hypothetical protein
MTVQLTPSSATPPGGPPGDNGSPPDKGGLSFLFARISNIDGHEIQVRFLNVKFLFNVTAIVYQTTKIFVLEKLLIREVYRIMKLLKKIFTFFPDSSEDEEKNSFGYAFRAFLTDQRARHILLKTANNSYSVASGVYELITDNEISRMAYAALGFGSNFQPFSEGVMNTVQTIFRPMAVVKLTTKTSHVYLAAKKVFELDSDDSDSKKRATWILLGKAALDFGIEGARWGLYFAGLTSGSIFAVSVTLSVLGIISNSLGLYKNFFPVKENVEGNQMQVLVPVSVP